MPKLAYSAITRAMPEGVAGGATANLMGGLLFNPSPYTGSLNYNPRTGEGSPLPQGSMQGGLNPISFLQPQGYGGMFGNTANIMPATDFHNRWAEMARLLGATPTLVRPSGGGYGGLPAYSQPAPMGAGVSVGAAPRVTTRAQPPRRTFGSSWGVPTPIASPYRGGGFY